MEHLEKWPLLAATDSPQALKDLPAKQLPALAREIRDYLVFRTEENGGHLASNLGVVELTMAIHRVFDAPRDHVIFDVGHQSYVHKLLTGRAARFDTLRQPGGISGFTKRAESEYDPFGAGHSSTAISAALGMAQADLLAGRDAYTIAVVGDGALTGGLAFEGLNNCRPDLPLVIIINENEMSISPNTGRLATQLSHMRASRGYIRTKECLARGLHAIPLVGRPLLRGLRSVKRWCKHALYRENMFEHMGIHYLGPIDGHDLAGLQAMLLHAKRRGGASILHVKTVKGKGYAPAQTDAAVYHGLPPKGRISTGKSFSQIAGEMLCDMASKDTSLVAITAAMREGTGLSAFADRYPDRFFDVGIAEGHAVTFAAGLAAGGAKPVVALYSTFLQRAYDNVLHDVAIQRLPLLLCIDRAGLSAADGATHHGIYDVAMLSLVPDAHIFAPVTEHGLRVALTQAAACEGIAAVRYGAGEPDPRIEQAFYGDDLPDTVGVRVYDAAAAPVLTVLTHGRIAAQALDAAAALCARGIAVRILLCEYLAPYDTLCREVLPLLAGKSLLFLEEEIRSGGFGMHLSAALRRAGDTRAHHLLATTDGVCAPGVGQTPLCAAGLDAAHLEEYVMRICQNEGEKIC